MDDPYLVWTAVYEMMTELISTYFLSMLSEKKKVKARNFTQSD